ncbi:hypothetical protein CPB86DRAFT_779928, partial [Serendipita vermifera]
TFRDACTQPPSEKALELLDALSEAACTWHIDETSRRTAIQDIFNDIAGLYLSPESVSGTEYKTDGTQVPFMIMPAAIRECKNEYGSALYEAIGYYVQFLVQRLSYRGTRFPCILMTDIGTDMGFYGCLWTGKELFAEPLTPLYHLTTPWLEETDRKAIASSLDAFLTAIKELRIHYDKLEKANLLRGREFPYQTSYKNEMEEDINFEYDSKIPEKLIFSARTNEAHPQHLCIKFAKRYSKPAHQTLADLGFAPRLRTVMELPGSWLMIVMDRSEYTLLSEVSLSLLPQAQLAVKSRVLYAVERLHERKLVHGDIRAVNILIDTETINNEGGCSIHIVDFDWAGTLGTAKYPMRVNTKTITRPEDVSAGGLITVDHDITMTNWLFSPPVDIIR